MAIKTTITLDAKADHDLLVKVVERRMGDLRARLDENLNAPPAKKMTETQKRELNVELVAVENLIRKIS